MYQVLAATDADADTEEVPVEGTARAKQKFVRKHGESSALSGVILSMKFSDLHFNSRYSINTREETLFSFVAFMSPSAFESIILLIETQLYYAKWALTCAYNLINYFSGGSGLSYMEYNKSKRKHPLFTKFR